MPETNCVRALTWCLTALRYCPCPTSIFCGTTCLATGGCFSAIRAGSTPHCSPSWAGRRLGPDRLLAVVGRSASYPEAQWRTAVELARRFDVPLLEVDTGELADPRYLGNPTNRCYFCKSELWTRLGQVARERAGSTPSSTAPMPTTWASTARELRAADEHRVRSPLAELGWTKAAVREASRALGLQPGMRPRRRASRAGSSTGWRSRPRRLRQVEDGEAFLRGLGVIGDLRVRHHGDRARIEVSPSELDAASARLGRRDRVLRSTGVRRGRAGSGGLPARRTADTGDALLADAAVRRHPDRRRGAARIVALLGRLREGDWPVRWVHDEGLHLTLKFFGEVAPERLEVIEEAVRIAGKGTGSLELG